MSARRDEEAMREKVARAIYAVIDAANSDPWEEVMRRRKLYHSTAGPEMTRAFAFADAAIMAAASCLPDTPPDPRNAALTQASTALSAVSADECTHASCRIRPETLAKAREALLTISKLHSWWGAQEIAIEALEATKGTSDGD